MCISKENHEIFEYITDEVLAETVGDDEYAGWKAWDFCHSKFEQAFDKLKNDKNATFSDDEYELLGLHLAAYLATWGMYRGYWKEYSYKLHKDAVKIILRHENLELLNLELNCEEEKIKHLVSLYEKLREHYEGKCDGRFTATQITKILLATLSCVPAYDTNFVAALSHFKIQHSASNNENLFKMFKLLFDFSNRNKLVETAKGMNEKINNMPDMRVLDYLLFSFTIKEKNKRIETN